MPARINPSILSADFVNFESELQRIAGADLVHVDVMDNHFVPNLTFGLTMVQRLQDVSPRPLDLHLMIEDPDRWAPDYAETVPTRSPFTPRPCATPWLSRDACARSAPAPASRSSRGQWWTSTSTCCRSSTRSS